jgi:hypothetical protein
MTYPKVARIDWFRVIVDLERARWSLERIAVAVERSKGWVSNLKNIPGTEPRFHDGLMLLGLWSQVTGKDRATVEVRAIVAAKGQEPRRPPPETAPASPSIPPKEPHHGETQARRPDSRRRPAADAGARDRATCAS